MSSDLDVIERLRTDPAPTMVVDLDRVTALARRRLQQRTARRVAVVAAAVVAATVAAVMVLAPDDRRTTTPPAGTSTTVARDLSITGNGGTELPDDRGSYTVVVDGGVLHIWMTRAGHKSNMSSTVVLPSGGTWMQIVGTRDVPVLLGVVPAGATDVDIVSAPGTPSHTVQTGPAEDFEAFVVRFDEPPADGQLTAVDLRWRLRGALHTALGTSPQRVEFDVTGAGRLAVSMTSPRRGAVTATLDGAPLGPASVWGDTPGSTYTWDRKELPDGRVLVWGVVPQQTLSVNPVLEGSATTGPAGMRPLGEHPAYLAYAVIVTGRSGDIHGIRTIDRSSTGVGYTE